MTPVAERMRLQILAVNKLISRDFDAQAGRNAELVDKLVSFLVSRGTNNILDVQKYVNEEAGLSFFYDKRTGSLFEQPGLVNAMVNKSEASGYRNDDLFTAFNFDGRFNYFVYLKFTPDGYPVFFTLTEDTGSDWVDIRGGLIFVAGIVVSFAFPALGAYIGTAVMGASAAAAYPLVAAAIGNACVAAVLNGGDIEAAAISAVAGSAGQGVGQFAKAATDSAMIGAAAAAATRALVVGGDIEKAVAGSLVSYGLQNAGSLVSSLQQGVDSMDLFASDNSFTADGGFNLDPLAAGPAVSYDYTFDPAGAPMAAGYDFGVTGSTMFDPLYQAPSNLLVESGWDYQAPDFSTPAMNVPNSPSFGLTNQPSVGGDDGDSFFSGLTSAALAALKIYTAVKNTQNPTVVRGITQNANGSTVQANSNGTVTTRSVTGQASVTRPAVGQAFILSNGNTMVNNGDGTYSTVTPGGVVTRTAYPTNGAAGASAIQPWMYAAGGLGLLLLLKG